MKAATGDDAQSIVCAVAAMDPTAYDEGGLPHCMFCGGWADDVGFEHEIWCAYMRALALVGEEISQEVPR
jgi:hypothetical protein